MRRTGERLRSQGALALLGLALLGALSATSALAAPKVSITQEVDRTEVGTEDTFRLEVVVKAPDEAQLQLPQYDDFEILSRSQGRQHSIQMLGGGPPVVESTLRVTLILRATRAGQLTLPPASVSMEGKTWRSEPLKLSVKEGSLGGGVARRPTRIPDPFSGLGMKTAEELLEEMEREFGGMSIPRGDSDLFLSLTTDKQEAYVGEQITATLWLLSRVDLSSVDAVTLPKLDGFFSEDVASPTQLTAQRKTVNGVPYRAYLLRRKALFAMKPGTLTIGRAEAEITTGFLFAGHRVQRKSEPLTLEIKPLPAGAPPGMSLSHVGAWSLDARASEAEVELGQPITVTLTLAGEGNLRNIQTPSLVVPEGVRTYDPKTSDKFDTRSLTVSGQRTVEYLLMPEESGDFVIPPVEFPYFNPETERYDTARTAPLHFSVRPGNTPSTALALPDQGEGARRLRPVRHEPDFETGSLLPWRSGVFLAAVGAPAALWLSLLAVGFIRGRSRSEDPRDARKRQSRSARKRLGDAERLAKSGSPEAFYAEVEKALMAFLEAQLNTPVSGLTRDALEKRLEEVGVNPSQRAGVKHVLETCELGRFAPGAASQSREEVLEACAAAMDGWGRS